jgi:hypothetical protein
LIQSYNLRQSVLTILVLAAISMCTGEKYTLLGVTSATPWCLRLIILRRQRIISGPWDFYFPDGVPLIKSEFKLSKDTG